MYSNVFTLRLGPLHRLRAPQRRCARRASAGRRRRAPRSPRRSSTSSPRCGAPTTTTAPRCASSSSPTRCSPPRRKPTTPTCKTYEDGLSNIVELLTAERDLANARYTLVLSRAELLIGAARVAYAAGAVDGSTRSRGGAATLLRGATGTCRRAHARGSCGRRRTSLDRHGRAAGTSAARRARAVAVAHGHGGTA